MKAKTVKKAKPTRKPATRKKGKKGKSTPMDTHVGVRLRTRRLLLGMTQEKLADAVGITFQQVQKYERGTNRVSASRLHQFCDVLHVPSSYFFEKYNETANKAQSETSGVPQYGFSDHDQEPFQNDDRLYDRETLELVRLYYSIADDKTRKSVMQLVKAMTESTKTKK